MASLGEIEAGLDNLLNTKSFTEQFPESNGLKISVKEEINSVATAVNLSNETIAKAEAAGIDLLVTHHASWENIDMSLKFKKHLELEKNAINLYVCHESLDSHDEISPSALLAKLLGVEVEGKFAGGYGVYGRSPKSFSELKAVLEKLPSARLQAWQHSAEPNKVAVVAGNGYMTNWLNDVFHKGCRTYVTGEGTMFTKLFAKDSGMNLLLGGHYATERLSMERLVKVIEQEFRVKAKFIEEESLG